MTYYLVKQTSKATDNNMFRGETKITYYGKQGILLACDGDYYEGCFADPLENNELMVRLCGYKTAVGAKRSNTYTQPENTEYWKSTAEIIAVKIVDGKVREVKR